MSDPIAPHVAVRPSWYPSKEALDGLPWPSEPPFCTACGQEMLTLGDLEQRGHPEWHAEEALNPTPCPVCGRVIPPAISAEEHAGTAVHRAALKAGS